MGKNLIPDRNRATIAMLTVVEILIYPTAFIQVVFIALAALPGPLFTFASYLGAMIDGWFGAIVATIAIFLPAFLLIIGALPFWNTWRKYKKMQAALFGMLTYWKIPPWIVVLTGAIGGVLIQYI